MRIELVETSHVAADFIITRHQRLCDRMTISLAFAENWPKSKRQRNYKSVLRCNLHDRNIGAVYVFVCFFLYSIKTVILICALGSLQ
jgi:hypothetical protein